MRPHQSRDRKGAGAKADKLASIPRGARSLPVAALILLTATLNAAPNIQPFLNTYCTHCHGPETKTADRSFASLDHNLDSPDARQQWSDILGRLNLSAMPPAGAKQPTDAERREIIDHMTARLAAARTEADSTGARTVLRRLNRYEYDRTVRDLLSLQDLLADPTDVFPPDAVEAGFDNIGAALSTSDFLLNGYLAAAETFIDAAVAPAQRPELKKYSFRAPFHPTRNRHDGQDRPGQYQNIRKNTSDQGGFLWLDDFLEGVPHSGYYTLRFKAEGVGRLYPYEERIVGTRKAEPIRTAVIAGAARYGELEFRTPSDRLIAEFDLSDEPRWYETRIWLDEGFQPRFTFPNGPIGVKPLRKTLVSRYPDGFMKFIRGWVVPAGPVNEATINESFTRRVAKTGVRPDELTTVGTSRSFNRREAWSQFFSDYQGPRVRIHEIEIEGPHYDSWPPAPHRALFGDLEPTLENTQPILERFASRAFRRPAGRDEITPLVSLVQARSAKGDSPLPALKTGLRAVLASPGFLYLREGEGPLDQHALASRLSYLLWSAPPDQQLLASNLSESALRTQALRMLSGPKTQAFSEQFTTRWLELYKIGSMPPSPKAFKQYYVDGLEQAMKQEAQLFFRHALENNLPLDTFLDSDFTFLNGGLARLYGIDGVRGAKFQKVSLDDPRRGGLLGMASVLTASANGIDTSPVVRGVWVLENILGTPPSPPPPDVEPLEPDIRGATTIRDQLSKHREIPTCNACHQSIDPLGFALENFDPIGGWRDRYPRPKGPGPTIDASGRLPSGERFESITDLKRILLENHRDQFARCLTEKLLTYATGRRLEPSDDPAIERILATFEQQGGGLRDLVLAVIESEPFRRN